jgi:hypothetical protein
MGRHSQPERKSAIFAYNIDSNRRKHRHNDAAAKQGKESPSPATILRQDRRQFHPGIP